MLPVGRSAGDGAALQQESASADGEGGAEEAAKAVLMQVRSCRGKRVFSAYTAS